MSIVNADGQHFAKVREEIAAARIRALDAAHHREPRECGCCGIPRNEMWECESCEAERQAPKAWWGI